MGSLRTIFAIAVVFAHSWPGGMMFVGGKNAVQLFYIISGFLISYVLVEKRAYWRVRDFYISRYLRLYPIYFFVACFTIAHIAYEFFTTGASVFVNAYVNAPTAADVLLVLSNFFLFGQDWVMFSGVENNALVFSKDFSRSEIALFEGLVVPQAWTLGVELTFYLIAPLVLHRKKWVFFLLALSICLRLYLISLGVGLNDPWNYRFFPTELALFLLGALSHQILLPLYLRLPASVLPACSNAATFLLIGYALFYTAIPSIDSWKPAVLFSAFILLMPLTFLFQGRYRFDSWIGELSYPIYIGHIFVIAAGARLWKSMGIGDQHVVSLGSVLLAVGFAVCLNKWIGQPFERVRNRFRGATRVV